MHVVSKSNVKDRIREKLLEFDIHNVTIELEEKDEICNNRECK